MKCPVCGKPFAYTKARQDWCDDCDDKLRQPAPRTIEGDEFERARKRYYKRFGKVKAL